MIEGLPGPFTTEQTMPNCTGRTIASNHVVGFETFGLFVLANFDVNPCLVCILADSKDTMLEANIDQILVPFLTVPKRGI